MNISKIIDMIESDEAPELTAVPPDPTAFRARVNVKNITQTISAPVIVQQAQQIITSIADMNGGLCTAADLKAARDVINARPLQVDADGRFEKIKAAIASGEVTNMTELKAKWAAIGIE